MEKRKKWKNGQMKNRTFGHYEHWKKWKMENWKNGTLRNGKMDNLERMEK